MTIEISQEEWTNLWDAIDSYIAESARVQVALMATIALLERELEKCGCEDSGGLTDFFKIT